jgi:hypothetical protein
MKNLIYLSFIFLLLNSCKSVDVVQFQPKSKGDQILPYLNLQCLVISKKGMIKTKDENIENDVRDRIEEEFYSNISLKSKTDNAGQMNLKADIRITGSSAPAILPTYLTMGLYPLLGLPLGYCKSHIELSANIVDSNNKMISKFSSVGDGKAKIACWFGYSGKNARKVSYLMALQMAMKDLEKQLQKDYSSINSGLINPTKAIAKNSSDNVSGSIASNSMKTNTTINTNKNISTIPPSDKETKLEVASNSDVDDKIPVTSNIKENAFALIVGNEDYSSFQKDLGDEVNVAYAMKDAKTFKEYCTKTMGVPEENIVMLINARTVEFNREISKLNLYAKNSKGNAELIFFYAGHGLPDETTKEPYLIPVDVSSSDLRFAIKLTDLYAELTEFPSKKVTVFLDACFSGGARNQGLVAARGVKIKPIEEPLSGNLVVFTASSGAQSSLPYKEKYHGMFTYFLLKKMQESGGKLTYKELSEYLDQKLSINSIKINNKEQNPQTNISPNIKSSWENWKFDK